MSDQRRIPPALFLRIFKWYCHPRLRAGIEGDLIELYQQRIKERGKRYADMQFAWDVIVLFRPGIIRKWKVGLNSNFMIKNYLIVSWRNILKNKAFSTINVVGLAVGLAACVLILEFVMFELSFDRFHSKVDRTYRITNDRFQNGKLIQHGTIMYPTIGPTMAKDFPEIEEYSRVMPGGTMNVKINDRNFRGDVCHFVDERFFRVFDFKLIAGHKPTLLTQPHKAVLTEKTARKFFEYNGKDLGTLLGKTFEWQFWGDPQPYEVVGILQDVPSNSHIQFDALISYSTLTKYDPGADNSWNWSDMRHYIVLKPGATREQLEAKFPEFSDRYFQGTKVSGSIEKFYLQPLRNAHLYSDYEYDIAETASGKAVWSMLIVAIFILVIAWINYVNLTTSRAIDRAKEVGVRKVMGAFKSELVKQFIVETLLLTSVATIVAFLVITLLQSSFNEIVGTDLSWRTLLNHATTKELWLVVAALIGCAILAGFYPAFLLSRYQPGTILKGKFTRSAKGSFIRKTLVIFQFTTSAALICGTLIVSKQIEFMNTTDLGLNLRDIVVVNSPELAQYDSTFIRRVEDFKNDLTNLTGVVHATTSWQLPGERLGRAFNVRIAGQPGEMHYTISQTGVDYDFFKTMQIDVLAGRAFIFADHNADWEKLNTVIINKNASALFGFKTPEEAIGHEILWGDDGKRKWKIIGVVADYHQEALQKPMEPMAFRPAYATGSSISIKINTADKTNLLTQIQSTYKKYFPGNAFEYSFLQDRYNKQYSDDKRFGKVITIFTALAIVVACLGLIGLSSYTAVLRTKEIGIRKVLGASVVQIVSILSFDFIRLVVIASLLALPIAYISMSRWLESYAYRIDLGWSIFLLPLVIVVCIAAATIGFQVLKSAMTKPVETLKYE